MTPETAGPKTGKKCQSSGHRSHNSGPSSQVSGHGSQVSGHRSQTKRIPNFSKSKKLLAFAHTVDELELKLFNFVVDS